TATQHRLHLVAGDERQAGGGRLRRDRAAARKGPDPWKQRPELRVDEVELLPPPPDLREQVGAVAAHLLRRPARVEHLLEQSEYLRVAGHRRSPHGEGVSPGGAGSPGAAGRRSASCCASRSRARPRRRCTVFWETPTTAAASACVSP